MSKKMNTNSRKSTKQIRFFFFLTMTILSANSLYATGKQGLKHRLFSLASLFAILANDSSANALAPKEVAFADLPSKLRCGPCGGMSGYLFQYKGDDQIWHTLKAIPVGTIVKSETFLLNDWPELIEPSPLGDNWRKLRLIGGRGGHCNIDSEEECDIDSEEE